MSTIDKRALREAAEKTTKGQWVVEFDDEIYSTDGVNNEQIAMVFSENEARDAAFIAAANPAAVLALLDELEVATDACNGWKRKFAEADERLEATERRAIELEAALNRLYSQCDTGFRRGNGSQEGVAMPSWVVVEETRLLLGVK